MKTKSMLTEMLYDALADNGHLHGKIVQLQIIIDSARSRVDQLLSDRQPDSDTVAFAIDKSGGRKLTAITILRRITGVELKEAKALIDAKWEK